MTFLLTSLRLSLHLSEARISSSTAYPETPSACVPLNPTEQVSRPYKTMAIL